MRKGHFQDPHGHFELKSSFFFGLPFSEVAENYLIFHFLGFFLWRWGLHFHCFVLIFIDTSCPFINKYKLNCVLMACNNKFIHPFSTKNTFCSLTSESQVLVVRKGHNWRQLNIYLARQSFIRMTLLWILCGNSISAGNFPYTLEICSVSSIFKIIRQPDSGFKVENT